MTKNLFLGLEELVYGKRRFNLHIELRGLETLLRETEEKIKHKIPRYIGDFIVTEQGYLRRGKDESVSDRRFAKLDLSECENVAGLLNLNWKSYFRNIINGRIRIANEKENDIVHIHYSDESINCIIRDFKGLKIEAYVPLLKRFRSVKIKAYERELIPTFV
jgi:hypothetical protein